MLMNVTIHLLGKRSFVFAVMRREMSKAEHNYSIRRLFCSMPSNPELLCSDDGGICIFLPAIYQTKLHHIPRDSNLLKMHWL
jgi:hypothetical protein